ncbi:MAG TPA: FAD-binding oxidoreductase [Thermoleophilaceae bacterium]|jgi:FAD/FMN-containing dehydrogenase
MAIQDSETRTVVGDASLQELEEQLRGELIRPSDAGYDEARAIWNGAIDKRPAAIVRCAGVSDVSRAVEFAHSQDLLVAVRGGKHSLPGFSTCDDGLVIDLSGMKGMRVDPAARTARAEAGLTWSEFDHEAQAFGLATTGGLISTTGIAGFTLGGGIGWLMRAYGLTCDNLISADMVSADGELVHASQSENTELFWGLRGGGGNFGVVTSFEYRLHPVGPVVMAGPVFYDGERAGELLEFFRDFTKDLPDEATTLLNLATAPPAPFLPESIHGKRVAVLIGVYAGPVAEGERVLAPMRELGDPVADLMGPIPYVAMQSLLDALYPAGGSNYFKAGYMEELSDASIATMLERHAAVNSPMSEIHVHHFGGAVARVPEADTAFGNRSAEYVLNVLGRTPDANGFDEAVDWARGAYDALEPYTSGGTYTNFMSAGDDRVKEAYGQEKYDRLVALKDRYDPTNLFRLNQNIKPSTAP